MLHRVHSRIRPFNRTTPNNDLLANCLHTDWETFHTTQELLLRCIVRHTIAGEGFSNEKKLLQTSSYWSISAYENVFEHLSIAAAKNISWYKFGSCSQRATRISNKGAWTVEPSLYKHDIATLRGPWTGIHGTVHRKAQNTKLRVGATDSSSNDKNRGGKAPQGWDLRFEVRPASWPLEWYICIWKSGLEI